MILRLVACVLVLCIGCKTGSKTVQTPAIAEGNKDVVALSYLIRDYLRKTGNTYFALVDIEKNDSSGQVAKNFSQLAIANWPNIWRGGYTVYFKFSNKRNKDLVQVLPTPIKSSRIITKKTIGRNAAQLAAKFDGEIHFYYPERHYNVAEIILKDATR